MDKSHVVVKISKSSSTDWLWMDGKFSAGERISQQKCNLRLEMNARGAAVWSEGKQQKCFRLLNTKLLPPPNDALDAIKIVSFHMLFPLPLTPTTNLSNGNVLRASTLFSFYLDKPKKLCESFFLPNKGFPYVRRPTPHTHRARWLIMKQRPKAYKRKQHRRKTCLKIPFYFVPRTNPYNSSM